jgi:hypothetical protein
MDIEPIDKHIECILCHENHHNFVDHPWGIISLLQQTMLVWIN